MKTGTPYVLLFSTTVYFSNAFSFPSGLQIIWDQWFICILVLSTQCYSWFWIYSIFIQKHILSDPKHFKVTEICFVDYPWHVSWAVQENAWSSLERWTILHRSERCSWNVGIWNVKLLIFNCPFYHLMNNISMLCILSCCLFHI